MKTAMSRRQLFAAIGIAALAGCGRNEHPQPEPPQEPDSTVTLVVDGMI
jgi:hypothetical protein